MKILLTHSKTLDFESDLLTSRFSISPFLDEAETLCEMMKKMSVEELMKFMKVSRAIAQKTFERFCAMDFPFDQGNSRPALLTYKGDVFRDFELDKYEEGDFDYAEKYLRIISGFYGVLRPFDLIQAYRMEMKLNCKFWKERLTEYFAEEDVLVILASGESIAAVDFKKCRGRVVNVVFKDYGKDGKLRIVAIYAKYMRGNMANWMIRNKILEVDDLKTFDNDGYSFNEELSSEDEFVFVR